MLIIFISALFAGMAGFYWMEFFKYRKYKVLKGKIVGYKEDKEDFYLQVKTSDKEILMKIPHQKNQEKYREKMSKLMSTRYDLVEITKQDGSLEYKSYGNNGLWALVFSIISVMVFMINFI